MFVAVTFFLLLTHPMQAPKQDAPHKQPESGQTEYSDSAARLLRIHRICVEPFGDDQTSRQLHAMVINALNESRRFVITEKCEKADAILKGVSTEQVHQEAHSSSEETSVGDSGRNRSAHVGIADSSHSTETINDAHLAVRLVEEESGDVIWSATEESSGAKYKSAIADAAEKVVKKLLWDLERIGKQAADGPGQKTTGME